MDYSLYLIGSKARGDHNTQSDTDYVCIYNIERPEFPNLQNSNISYYSAAKMQWMVLHSRLFVKHILVDGRLLVENEAHTKLLKSFILNRKILAADSEEFILQLKEFKWFPSGHDGYRWACDYTYTIARNIIYIQNALNETFDFGYEGAVQAYLDRCRMPHLISDFIELRNGKYRYRSKSLEREPVDKSVLDRIITLLTGQSTKLAIGGRSQFFEKEIPTYKSLRMLERAILNGEIEGQGYIEKLMHHGEYFFFLRKQARDLICSISREAAQFH